MSQAALVARKIIAGFEHAAGDNTEAYGDGCWRKPLPGAPDLLVSLEPSAMLAEGRIKPIKR